MFMGSKERREREREEVRTQILDAARELFAAEGIEAVTMRALAERIEYSATAIYLHFPDKQSVIRELCARDFRALAGAFGKIAQIADPVERIRAAGSAYAEFALAHPHHYRLMFMTPLPPLEPEPGIERGNPDQDAYAFLRSAVAEAIAADRLRDGLESADAASQVLWGGIHGLVSLWITKGDDPWIDWGPRREVLELMIDTLIRGLLRAER